MGWTTEKSWFDSWQGEIQTDSEVSPASRSAGTGGSFPRRLKRPAREADHLLQRKTVFKLCDVVYPYSPYTSLVWCLLTHIYYYYYYYFMVQSPS